jgi:alanine dehydrogenase
VLVDVAIDQGGIFATTDHTTTHDHPTYVKYGVVHYAVANMPGAVPRTATLALTNVTLPYALEIANKGWRQALSEDVALRKGLNVAFGHVTYLGVAEALNAPYMTPEAALAEVGVPVTH